ncbi:pre-mRNA-processing protein 40C-like isoform X2 [Carica papaya]|uniref:pre-mRNA-processing protein 40C-like isoform X2 n=1 Tax=Carica papaya TaxID=3649 RepID=UPI000B8CA7CD|nr:pre-mRNA-processing protein 40C-like isoform X2 [Carica papaya]
MFQPVTPNHLQGVQTTQPSTVASLQPPVPGQSAHPSSLVVPKSSVPGTAAPVMPSFVPVPEAILSNAPKFSFNGNSQLMKNSQLSKTENSVAVAQTIIPPSASTVPQSVPSSVHPSGSSTSVPSNSGLGLTTPHLLSTTSFPRPPGLSGTPSTPGPPGLVPSQVTALSLTDGSTSSIPRPPMPTVPASANPAVQQQIYPAYPSLPAMADSPQGIWLQPAQIGGIPCPPFWPHPAVYPGPYPLPALGSNLPSAPLSYSQPVGVTSLGTAGASPASAATSDHQLAGILRLQTDSLPGIGMLRVSC